MVRVREIVGRAVTIFVVLTAPAPAAAQFIPDNTPIQSITLQQSGNPTLVVGGNTLFGATAILADANATTRMLGGGGSAFWNVSWAPGIGVSVCNPQASSYTSQNIHIDSAGVFHQVWSPSQPDTLKADGLMTMPTASPNATLTASLACFSGSPTGSMSATWTGTHYDGTYAFNGGSGAIVVYGLRWSTDNAAVATVDDRGVVTGTSEGDATITAHFGSLCWHMMPGAAQCFGETSASVPVHVNPAPDPGGGGGGGGGSGPFMTAGPDRTLECTGPEGASATMQGAIFFEPESPLTYVWSGPFGTATGLTPTVPIPLGSHTVTFTISDGVRSASDSADITVVDNQPPQIASVAASPSVLWPPNHKMAPVSLSVEGGDACSPALTCRIVGVSGNDGATADDWEVTGPLSLMLRSERRGGGGGRTYVVTVECRDAAGNASTRIVEIRVPHDRR
jgi:hypothetical protein